MKKTQIILLLFIGLMFSVNAYSQVDRRIGRSYSKPKKEVDKTDYIQLSVDKLAEDLALDGFQAAVIKDMINASQKEQMKVYEEDIPNESKMEKLKVLQDKCIAQIKTILNPEQLKKYEDLMNKQKKKR